MTITVKAIQRRKLSRGVRRQLAAESVFALVRLRQTGQPPTHEDSPLPMCIWQRVLERVLERGAEAHIYLGDVGIALRITVSALWDDQNSLSKFMVYDAGVGNLLLVGDMAGPVFPGCKPSTAHAAIENPNETNLQAIS